MFFKSKVWLDTCIELDQRSCALMQTRELSGSFGAPMFTLATIHGFRLWFLIVGLALPAALIVVGVATATASGILFAIAGLCITAAGAALKFFLITRAGFNQGFALTHTPARGSGPAGPAAKPGWSIP